MTDIDNELDNELDEETDEELEEDFEDFDEEFDEDLDEEEEDDEEDEQPVGHLASNIPVDMTKDEYIHYSLAFARQFGMLRMQKLSMIMFAGYLVIIGGSVIAYYHQTGIWDWMLLLLLLITLLSSALILTLVPMRVKKSAIAAYDAANIDGYYGEVTVTTREIIKRTGEGEVRIPLNERTLYVEDRGFMAFSSQGMLRGIVLPSRCVTAELGAAVRKAVFSSGNRVRRRVVNRLTVTASHPIDARPMTETPVPLHEVRVRYETEDIQRLLVDSGWRQYVQSLPIIVTLGVLLGTVLAMLEENLPVFFVALVGTVVGMLILSMLGTRSKSKRAAMLEHGPMLTVELNDFGVVLVQQGDNNNSDNRILTRWSCLTRAVERPDCVDITAVGRLIRIPKRCILDLDEFRNIVDAHYPSKS